MPDLGKTQSDLWFWKLPVFLYSISTFLQFSRKNLFPQSLFPGNKRCFKIRTCGLQIAFFLDLKLLGCHYGMNEFPLFRSQKTPSADLQQPRFSDASGGGVPPNIEHTWTLRVDTVLGGGFKDCIFLILCLP